LRMSRKTRRNASRKAIKASGHGKLRIPGFVLGSVAISGTLFAAEPADTPAAPAAADQSEIPDTGDHNLLDFRLVRCRGSGRRIGRFGREQRAADGNRTQYKTRNTQFAVTGSLDRLPGR